MKLTIKINLDNAAFDNMQELMRIFKKCYDWIVFGKMQFDNTYENKHIINDVNGNKVGYLKIENE